jgi:hypothetical protein
MRTELEEIETIEKYLLKEFDTLQLANFDKELAHNDTLKEKVQIQKWIMLAIDKKAFKELAAVSYRRFILLRILKWILLVMAISLLIGLIFLLSHDNIEHTNNISLTSKKGDLNSFSQKIEDKNGSEEISALSFPITSNEDKEEIKIKVNPQVQTNENKLSISSRIDTAMLNKVEWKDSISVDTKKKMASGWVGKFLMNDRVDQKGVGSSVSENGELILYNTGNIKGDMEHLIDRTWKFENNKTKININQVIYDVQWIVNEKSFRVKIKDGASIYECTFKYKENIVED